MTPRERGKRKAEPGSASPAAATVSCRGVAPARDVPLCAFADGDCGGAGELLARAVEHADPGPGDVVGELTLWVAVKVELLHPDGRRSVRRVSWRVAGDDE